MVANAAEPSRQSLYKRRTAIARAEIGELPEVDNPGRKSLCKFELVLFAVSYFPETAGLTPLSPRHLRALERMQRAILKGGKFLQIMFRGGAKSTLSEIAILWGLLYGHIKFPLFIAADGEAADVALDSIKSELEENDLLFADFPEVCYPIRCLEGKVQRTHSQTFEHERTRIEWTAKHIVLPTIKGSAASGAILKTRGITGGMRGVRHKRADGTQARPDFVILDDPQTDQSAASPAQVKKRLGILNKSILRLGGHKKTLAVVCNATIIEPDDMVDQLADRDLNPSWQTERVPMLVEFDVEKLDERWLGKYADLRNNFDPDDLDGQEKAHQAATEYYRKNRAKMDRGLKATWLSCYDEETEISAIQHAINILIDTGLEAFLSECQNEPAVEDADLEMLTPKQIVIKQSGFRRNVVPAICDTLTAMIDVQGSLLYYTVFAWDQNFSGYLVDYGTFPDQRRNYFRLSDVRKTLRRTFKGTDDEGAISQGLRKTFEEVVGKEYKRADGIAMRISRCLVDANWGKTSELVNHVCRSSPYAATLTPSYGRGIKATQAPIHAWKQSQGKPYGPEWVPVKAAGKRTLISVVYDTYYWKKRFHDALALPLGNRGSLAIFERSKESHKMLADQWTAESPKKVESDGRTVFEWKEKPGADNHFFDCAVGSMVAASMVGINNRGEGKPTRRRRKSRIT